MSGSPRLVGWGAWCLVRQGEIAVAADLHPDDVAAPDEIGTVLTQSGAFSAVYCWSREGATAVEMMLPSR